MSIQDCRKLGKDHITYIKSTNYKFHSMNIAICIGRIKGSFHCTFYLETFGVSIK